MKKQDSNRLNGKDLMNIGLFTALSIVIGIFVAAMIGLIPIGFLFINIVTPLIAGTPMMLFFAKVKKFGMVMIMTIINGIIVTLIGTGPYALILGILCAFVAEWILKSGKYASINKAILAFAVLNVASAANYIPWINASAQWVEKQTAAYGDVYMSTTLGYFENWWILPVLIIASFISSILGGLIGKVILKKHFVRSGLI